jgi:hypothetical protein
MNDLDFSNLAALDSDAKGNTNIRSNKEYEYRLIGEQKQAR